MKMNVCNFRWMQMVPGILNVSLLCLFLFCSSAFGNQVPEHHQTSSTKVLHEKEHPAVLSTEDSSSESKIESNTIPVSLIRGRVSSQPSRYILGPGDKISVQVKDLDKFNQDLTIRPDGYGTVHPFGEFMLAGMDVQGLQDWLSEKFKYYLVNPQLTIDVKEMRPALVYITGAVKRPGIYQFLREGQTNATVDKPLEGKVEITLANILSQAGGVKANADITHISVQHDSTGQTEIFNLRELLAGVSSRDIWLLPGDIVSVPDMDQPMDPETFKLVSQSTFYQDKFPVVVLGAVQKQGEVQLDPSNNSLNAAIGLAGGFMNQLSNTDAIIVQRPTGQGSFNRWIIHRKKLDMALMPGDVLYVSNAKLASVEHGLKILSSIGQPVFFGANSVSTVKSLIEE